MQVPRVSTRVTSWGTQLGVQSGGRKGGHFFGRERTKVGERCWASSRGGWPLEVAKLAGCRQLTKLHTSRGEGDLGTPQTGGGIEAVPEPSNHDWIGGICLRSKELGALEGISPFGPVRRSNPAVVLVDQIN